jgi:hypothetical protein
VHYQCTPTGEARTTNVRTPTDASRRELATPVPTRALSGAALSTIAHGGHRLPLECVRRIASHRDVVRAAHSGRGVDAADARCSSSLPLAARDAACERAIDADLRR